MATLRTPEMKKKYQEYQKLNPVVDECAICSKAAIKTFKHWKVTDNAFPYDLIASKHHMIVPLRHVPEKGLNKEERTELESIKEMYIDPTYDYIIEATPKNKSIPAHFHLHLIIGKP